nr:Ig-like domain-containing protein [Gemmatimonadota bacterium]
MPIDKRPRLALFLLPVLLLGCKQPTGGASAISSIVILQNSVPFEEQSIAVGDGLQLTASPRDASNRPLEGRSIEWSSSQGNVASVDGSGAVRGLAIGTAWIRAASGGVRDSARVNVSERFTGLASCEPGEASIQLPVGGVHVTSAFETPTLCVRAGAAGTEYVLVPFHASAVAGGEQGSRLTVELTASGTVSTLTTEAGVGHLPLLERSSLAAAGTADEQFHLRLRERTLRELRPRLRSIQAAYATGPSQATLASSPTAGQILQINVRTDTACAAPRNRSGRVVAVTNRAVVVADESNPSG